MANRVKTLRQALRRRYGESERDKGLWVEKHEIENWINLLPRSTG